MVKKVALVTGGSGGMGRAIAQRLSGEGARVFTAQRGEGAEFEGIVADLSDPDVPARVMGQILDRAGRLDVLVNNAGMMREAGIEQMSIAEWQKTLAVNLTAPFRKRLAFFA